MNVLDVQRSADRRRIVALVAARPSPARFRTFKLNVRLLDQPAKTRLFVAGGANPHFTGECMVVLPIGEKPPQAALELIDITDFAGETQTYNITTSTPLLGTGCFRLGLGARRGKPRSAVPGA